MAGLGSKGLHLNLILEILEILETNSIVFSDKSLWQIVASGNSGFIYIRIPVQILRNGKVP